MFATGPNDDGRGVGLLLPDMPANAWGARHAATFVYPAHAGEIESWLAKVDWAATPLGPRQEWPDSLRIALGIVLASRLPMMLLWGPDLSTIYNDACVPVLGRRHPEAFGRSARIAWGEVWDTVAPLFEAVRAHGQSTWTDDQLLPLPRRGGVEERYFTCGASPVVDERGGTGGVLVTISETTTRVIGERRLRTLRALGGSAAGSGVEETGLSAMRVLSRNPADIPFALLYLFPEDDDGPVRLVASCGVNHGGHDSAWSGLAADKWPIDEAARRGRPVIVHELPGRPGLFSGAPWPEAPRQAVVLPLVSPGRPRAHGCLVVGVSPRCEPDDEHDGFLALLGGHVTSLLLAAAIRAAAETERRKLHSLFMQAPVPIAVFEGPEHRIALANPLYVRLVHGRDLVGKPLLEALPELEGQELVSVCDRVFRTGVPVSVGELPVSLETGDATGIVEERFWSAVWHPTRDVDGAVDGIMAVANEITSQVRAERERTELLRRERLARAEADAANRAKDEFLAMLGHELRNPLSPILTAAQMMRLRGLATPELDLIDRQLGHLLRLVDDLLDVSRIIRGKITLQRRRVDLGGIVARAVEMARPLLEQRRHALVVDMPACALLVDGDSDRLAQVVANLLTNASKYSDAATSISLTCAVDDGAGTVSLSVRDRGIGIAAEMLERIFDVFVQQPQTLDRAHGGLGLGLAIVKSFVELHDGWVRAYSDGLGCGSAFVVTLPMAAAGAVAALPTAAESWFAVDAGPRRRVLVVDDNEDVGKSLADALGELGHDVERAADGPSALLVAERFSPEIALLDIGLPVMDGYELARRLRARWGGLRLFAVTGYGQEADQARSREAGFDGHLVKPVDLFKLARVLHGHTV